MHAMQAPLSGLTLLNNTAVDRQTDRQIEREREHSYIETFIERLRMHALYPLMTSLYTTVMTDLQHLAP